jgi:hypothetical protein
MTTTTAIPLSAFTPEHLRVACEPYEAVEAKHVYHMVNFHAVLPPSAAGALTSTLGVVLDVSNELSVSILTTWQDGVQRLEIAQPTSYTERGFLLDSNGKLVAAACPKTVYVNGKLDEGSQAGLYVGGDFVDKKFTPDPRLHDAALELYLEAVAWLKQAGQRVGHPYVPTETTPKVLSGG